MLQITRRQYTCYRWLRRTEHIQPALDALAAGAAVANTPTPITPSVFLGSAAVGLEITLMHDGIDFYLVGLAGISDRIGQVHWQPAILPSGL